MIRAISAGSSSDGVPPPKKIVSAGCGPPCTPARRLPDLGFRLRLPGDLRDQRLDVARLQGGVEQPAVEVAVVADGGTEGDVNVET